MSDLQARVDRALQDMETIQVQVSRALDVIRGLIAELEANCITTGAEAAHECSTFERSASEMRETIIITDTTPIGDLTISGTSGAGPMPIGISRAIVAPQSDATKILSHVFNDILQRPALCEELLENLDLTEDRGCYILPELAQVEAVYVLLWTAFNNDQDRLAAYADLCASGKGRTPQAIAWSLTRTGEQQVRVGDGVPVRVTHLHIVL